MSWLLRGSGGSAATDSSSAGGRGSGGGGMLGTPQGSGSGSGMVRSSGAAAIGALLGGLPLEHRQARREGRGQQGCWVLCCAAGSRGWF